MNPAKGSLRALAGWAIKLADGKNSPRPLIILGNDEDIAFVSWGTSSLYRDNAVIVELCQTRKVQPWAFNGHRLTSRKTAFYPKYATVPIARIELGTQRVNPAFFNPLEARFVALMVLDGTGIPAEDRDND